MARCRHCRRARTPPFPLFHEIAIGATPLMEAVFAPGADARGLKAFDRHVSATLSRLPDAFDHVGTSNSLCRVSGASSPGLSPVGVSCPT